MYAVRIQQLPQTFPQYIKHDNGYNQKNARKQRQPPFSGHQIFHRLGQDNADGRLLRGETESQKRDTGFMEDRMGKQQHQTYEKLRQKMRQHMLPGNVPPAFSKFRRNLNIRTFLQLYDFRPDQASGSAPRR